MVPVFRRIGAKEVLEAMQEHPHYQAAKEAGVGRGVSIGFWFNIGFDSAWQYRSQLRRDNKFNGGINRHWWLKGIHRNASS